MGQLVMLCSVVVVLAACGTRTVHRAPVAESAPVTSVEAGAVVAPAAQQPPGFENAGKAGYYTVKPGDTMIRIGMETGQSWRDIARWNGLTNPNVIEVGQVLRVTPPVASTVPAATVLAGAKPAAGASAPVAAGSTGTAAPAPATPSGVTTTAVAPAAVTATAVPPAQGGAAAAPAEDEVSLIWPAAGAVISGFDEVKNKGVDIGGAAGDPVVAAADGRVVYVGSSLRGYGNLIILKHNNTYLTAYAHNQALLVKEDQTVRKGQKIAEMGNSDADRIKLHFEVRRQGKPVDPAKYLPPR
ncbi:MAG: peptidoglycan DD-metalloendopeptidase family protein [Burkholderiaceae bacterium]|nr:peptidoglycan DD-metalloendopeptidase family protein [Rhodoferax sp.]MCB2041063.1 peptidoglycan DD-metalloendopeptidase family protein [Rhodoferax sp.]MCW5630944.1 peptidoglycan DD-metalloendopeptidase family protein [Rhodoferax sp.]